MATNTALKSKPRLKNLDDLFLINDGAASSAKDIAEEKECSSNVVTVPIDSLSPFSRHPFRLYDGERLDDMVESVKQHGVLIPVIVRRVGETLEILSGHNRVNAAKLAGLKDVPVLIRENISDEDAWIYVIETNLIQRSFAEMTHSEKAAVIASHHSKLFSQGKRNDIIAELKALENPHEKKENNTSVQSEHRLTSREIVAKEYSLDRNTVARYLRVFHLTEQMKVRLDNGDFGFVAATTLSFLSEAEQVQLDKCIELNRFKVDGKKADMLRQFSQQGKLDEDNIYLILSGEIGNKPKVNRTPTIKVNKTVYAQYFRPDQSAKEVQKIVEAALALYFSQAE